MKRTISRRDFLRMAAIGTTATVASACGATPTATPVPTKPPAPLSTQPPATATVAVRQAPADMAPKQVFKYAWEGGLGQGPIPGFDMEATINPFVFMSLLTMDADAKVLPWLATGYEVSADNKVYTVRLDKRAKWSDGKPVTATDFKVWYDWAALPAQKSSRISFVLTPVKGFTEVNTGKAETIEGIEAVDDFTLRFTLSYPEGFFAQRLAMPFSACGRLEQYKADPKFWLAEKAKDAIVNGPFKMVHMEPEPGAIYKWETNPNWWGDKKPWLTNIEGTTMRDQQTMLLAFENGDIDAAIFLSGSARVLLRKKMPDVFVSRPYANSTTFEPSAFVAPTDDVNLRLALMHAIDWDKMAQVAWEGDAPASQAGYLCAPGLPCRDANYKAYPFDVAKAKEYLAKSKYGPTGDKVPKIRWSTAGSDTARIRSAQIIQEYWRVNLGIENVEIKNVESEFGSDKDKINIFLKSAGAFIPNPAFFMQNFAARQKDPTFDKMVSDLSALPLTDPNYCSSFQKAMQYIQGQAVAAATSYRSYDSSYQKWVKGGVKLSGAGVLYTLMDIYMAKR